MVRTLREIRPFNGTPDRQLGYYVASSVQGIRKCCDPPSPLMGRATFELLSTAPSVRVGGMVESRDPFLVEW